MAGTLLAGHEARKPRVQLSLCARAENGVGRGCEQRMGEDQAPVRVELQDPGADDLVDFAVQAGGLHHVERGVRQRRCDRSEILACGGEAVETSLDNASQGFRHGQRVPGPKRLAPVLERPCELERV